MAEWCPFVWGAFEDYRLHAHSFSRQEMDILREIVTRWDAGELAVGRRARASLKRLFDATDRPPTIRERKAFLKALGLR